jgi:hypothetical protein
MRQELVRAEKCNRSRTLTIIIIIITVNNRRRQRRHFARPVSHNRRTCVSQIHRPWVRKTRQNVFGAEVDPDNLEPWVTAVAWSDGAIQELQGVLHPDNEAKDDAEGIRRMKHGGRSCRQRHVGCRA